MMADPIFDFVMARDAARRDYASPRCYGRSSDALVAYALGYGPRPQVPGHSTDGYYGTWTGDECGRDYPHDLADLNACELSYEMAPAVVRIAMQEVLEEFRLWVHSRINRYGDVLADREAE